MATRCAGEDRGLERFNEYCTWAPHQRPLLDDLQDGRLDDFSEVDAALVIAGHSEDEIASFRQTLNASIRRLRAGYDRRASQQSRLRNIFSHLSREFLHGNYEPELFDIGRTLSTGDFNCLTATLLYKATCQRFGIEVVASWEPSHVCCWSPLAGDTGYVVETTADSTENAIGQLSHVDQLPTRQLDSTQLVAKVFYNRGVSEMKAGDYGAALGSTWAGSLLDPLDNAAQSNVRACLNNWALTAAEANDPELARRLLEAGVRLDPDYQPFTRNREILFRD